MDSEDYVVQHYDSGILSSFANTDHLKSPTLHMHNYYEMNLFLDGDIVFFIGERKIKPQRGMLFFIDSTQIHGPKMLKSERYKRAIVHFNPQLARRLSLDNCNLLECFSKVDASKNDFVILNEKHIEKFSQLTQQLQEIGEHPNFFGKEVLESAYLAELLVLANSERLESWEEPLVEESHSLLVRDIMNFVSIHLLEEISLDDIEKKLAMNRHYLNRVFKKETDISIYQYVILKKISYAKKLMTEGYTPKEVAVILNYQDYSTFLRAFKQITNVTPTIYMQTQT